MSIVKKIIGILLIFCLFLIGQPIMDTSQVRIGLALSGGGALGFAHLGVLKVLEREGIPISYITGCSMGSLIGGIYAAGYKTAQIESIAVNADWSSLFSSSPSFGSQYLPERQQSQRYVFQVRHRNLIPVLPTGIIPLQNVEFILTKLLSNIEYNTYYDFDSLPIPYRAIAVDLISGNKVCIKSGRLTQAIRASIAIPGVFSPELINGQELVDGGVQQFLPVSQLFDFKPNFIIASVTEKRTPETGVALIDVISRSIDLIGTEDLTRQKGFCNIIIEPNVDPFKHSDFSRAQDLIKAGEIAAESALPEIKAKLAGRTFGQTNKEIASRPASIIHAIRFEGLKSSRESVLRHELRIKQGEFLNFTQLYSDLVRLFNTGLFSDVDYHLEFVPPDSVDVVIELQEQAYGFYSLGLRYDNYDNFLVGLEIGQGNLWGSGASVRGVIHLGNPNEYRLGLTGTKLFNLPFGYGLDAFWNSINHVYYRNQFWSGNYNIDSRGGMAGIGYILGRNAYFNFGIQAYHTIYQQPSSFSLDSVSQRPWIVGPTFNYEYNSSDNLFMPTRGLAYHLSITYTNHKLKSDYDFWKFYLSSKRIIHLAKSLSINYGYEFGISLKDLALSEYFHTGGENFIGYRADEFTTPNKIVFRLGADYKLFELYNRSDYPLFLQVIANIGTFQKIDSLIKNRQDINQNFSWGLGLGLKTNSPIGPFQIVFGINNIFKPAQYQKRINIFVVIGRDFRYTKV
jgi:NTE family protein